MAVASDTAAATGIVRASARAARRAHYVPSVRQVEWSLYACAASGALLFEPLGIPWSMAAPVLVAHIVGGAVLAGAVVAPFWLRHRKRLQNARSRERAITGRVIELGLVGLFASGLVLFLIGNRGDLLGRVAHELHLWLTFPLIGVLAVHMARASTLATLLRGGVGRGSSRRRAA